MPRSGGEGADGGVPLVLLLVTTREKATRGSSEFHGRKRTASMLKEASGKIEAGKESRLRGAGKGKPRQGVCKKSAGVSPIILR